MGVVEVAEHLGAGADDGVPTEFDESAKRLLVAGVFNPAHGKMDAARVNILGIVGSGRRVLGHADH